MKHVSLGGLDVSRIGLGAMTMAGTYTTGGGLDDAESIRTIHRALDLGVTPAHSGRFAYPLAGHRAPGRQDDEVRRSHAHAPLRRRRRMRRSPKPSVGRRGGHSAHSYAHRAGQTATTTRST